MFKHYITVAFRNFFRNKIYSFINILGLAVGMGACILIYQYVHFEMSYDKFHTNAQNTYRVTQDVLRNGETIRTGVFTPHALGVASKITIPEITTLIIFFPPIAVGTTYIVSLRKLQ